MLSAAVGSLITIATLALFALVALRTGDRRGAAGMDHYLTARDSQRSGSIALTFFASALGAWILFSPPEVGTFGGLLAVLGYAGGQALAIAIFAVLGPKMRATVPAASTILEFVHLRYGRVQQGYVAVVSVLYMFLFLAAELTAIGGVVALVAGVDPLVTVIAVAAVTAAYTAYGGLPASISTDRWQAWLIVGLVVAGVVAVVTGVPDPLARAQAGGFGRFSRVGAETMTVLVIAIIAANLFHQGFWQRVWSARSDEHLVRGTLVGAAAIFPVVLLLGVSGMIAAADGIRDPSVAFFSLVDALPRPVLAAILVLAVALVASSVDTLQNALASLVAVHVAGSRMDISTARVVTVVLTIPAALIAIQELSVLRIFLIADLLAATIAFPVFLGLWRRVTPSAALAGSIAGVAGIVILGWVRAGMLADGFLLLTLPDGPSLGAFLVAPAASAVVTLGATFAAGRAGRPAYHRVPLNEER